jgi:hypothetical protein
MRRPALSVFFALVAAACAHGDAFEQGVLRKGNLAVRVGPLPPGWRRIDVGGADLAFRDEAREGSTLLDVRCGRRDDDAPLTVLTDHLAMGTTERQIESQDTVPFDGREAMHTLLSAKLDGVPMRYDIYVVKKDGCVYDIVYVAAPDRFAEGAPDFESFALGVRSLPTDAPARSVGRQGPESSRDP